MSILVFETDELGVRWYLKKRATGAEAGGMVTDIATESATLRMTDAEGKDSLLLSEINDTAEAIEWIRDILLGKELLSSNADLRAIAQYVMHGGTRFRVPTLLTEDVLLDLDKWKAYAPVTMEINLAAIVAVTKLFPGVPQIAVFDTAFHHTLPEHAALYAIPYDYTRKHKIRRYGFHGIHHNYMMRQAIRMTGLKRGKSRLITIEIGYGTSVTAIRNGVSIDTSMGFSRMEGPAMLERAGTINFDVLSFLHTRENMPMEEIHTMLYRFSGLIGLSGGLHSIEEILSAVDKGDKVAKNAYQTFIHGIRRHIGSSLLVLGGVDAIAVSGALAEKHPCIREDIFEDLTGFGIVVDTGLNEKTTGAEDAEISSASSTVKVLYIRRNSGRAIFEEVEKTL